MEGECFATTVIDQNGSKKKIILYPGIPVAEIRAVLGAAFQFNTKVVGVKDSKQNIAFPLSLLSRAPAYFAKRDAYDILLETQNPKLSPEISIDEKTPLVFDLRSIKMADAIAVFKQMSSGGSLDRQAFMQAFSKLLGKQITEVSGAQEQLNWLFSIFDKDCNGVVDSKEFLGGLSIYAQGEEDAEEKIRQAFLMYDLNGNGFIELDEMKQYLSSVFTVLAEVMPEVFEKYQVSAEELAEATAVTCFKEADLNHDGLLSFEEFRAWYSTADGGLLCELAGDFGPQHFNLAEIKRLLNLGAYKVDDLMTVMGAAADDSVCLDRRSFARAFAGLLEVERDPPLTSSERQLAAYIIDKLFEVFDQNQNGAVDTAELAAGLSLLCGGTPEDKVRSAFNMYDKDRNGYITMGEMAHYLASVYRLLYETQPDLVNEVGCTVEELAKVTAEQAFIDADKNHDGKISFEEFCAWYTTGMTSASDLLAETNMRFSIDEVRKITRLHLYDVNDIFAFFVRSSGPDRKLTRSQFNQLFEALAAEKDGVPESERNTWEAALDQLFSLFDTSQTGYVDFKELGAGLTLLCGGAGNAKARAAFQLYDISGTGYISFQDMVDFLSSIYRVMYESNPGLGKQVGCGHQELAESTARECFEQADLDRDFRLSYQEFEAWYTQTGTSHISKAGEAPAFTVSEIQALTNIGARDVDSVFQMMADCADGSGYLTRHTFHGCFRAMAEIHQGRELDNTQAGRLAVIMDQLFDIFDTAGDGVISFEELAAGLSMLCHGQDGHKIAAVFNLYDADEDGYISLQEMASYLTSVFRVIFSTNPEARPDTTTSAEELGWITAESAFKDADLDHDGLLSYDEFVRWYKKSSALGSSNDVPVPMEISPKKSAQQGEASSGVSLEELLQLTRLHEIPISKLYEILMEISVDGFLDFNLFGEGFSDVVGPSLRFFTREDRDKMAVFARQIFDSFKKKAENDIEYIEVPELITGLSCISTGTQEQENVAAAFSLFDEDGDGYITLEGMTCILSSMFRFMYGVAHTETKISPEILASKVAKKFIQVVDSNHDGKISFGEFYKWYTSHGIGTLLKSDDWKDFLVFDVPDWLSLDETKRLTSLGQKSVQEVFGVFARYSNSSGDLTKEGFAEALAQFVSHRDEMDIMRFDYLCDRLFDTFDCNHDGIVSFAELAAGISVLCDGEDHESKVRTVFEFFDENGDGHISPDEMRSYFISVFRVLFETHPGLRERIGATPEEIGEATAGHAFEVADTNHDGDISYEEFKRWYSSGAGAFLESVSIEGMTIDEIKRITNLGEIKVKDAVQVFLGKADRSGKLSRAKFFAACAQFIDPHAPDANEKKKKLQVVLNGIFDVFDKDGNDVVDLRELSAGLSVICAGPPQEKVSQIFRLFDADADGFITFSEMKNYLHSVFLMMYETNPDRFKTDGVPPEQLAHVTALQAFMDADIDHDGVISLDEFTAWYTQGKHDTQKKAEKSPATEPQTESLPVPLFKPTPEMEEARRLLKLDCFSMEDLLETFAEASIQGRIGFAAYMRQFEYLHTLGGGLDCENDAPLFIEMAEKIFRAFENDEGTVNLASLITSLTTLCEIPFDEKITTAFSLYDLDGDNLINFTELVKYIACIFITLEAMSTEIRSLFDDPVELAIRTALECYHAAGMERSSKIGVEQFRSFICRQ